jgi:hypothetical protein
VFGLVWWWLGFGGFVVGWHGFRWIEVVLVVRWCAFGGLVLVAGGIFVGSDFDVELRRWW